MAVRRGLYELGGKVQHDAIESDMDVKPGDLIEDAEKDLYQISEKVVCEGIGLHSGKISKISIYLMLQR